MSEDWKPISSSARKATRVQVRMMDGTIHLDAHWASDLSGEDQPPFEGWFIPVKDSTGRVDYMRGIDEPEAWKEIQ